MEIYDTVLEEGREELTLDRPPPAVVDLGAPAINSLLTEDNDIIHTEIDKKLVKNCDIGGNENQLINHKVTELEEPVFFDPLLSSEKNSTEEVEASKELAIDTRVNELDMGNKNPEQIISTSVNLVSSSGIQKEKNTQEIKKQVFRRNRYAHGLKQPLISCLKFAEKNTQKKDKKSVHFPDGPDCITEFIAPVDPWRDVRTPSKGEVISFYRNACQKLRCKPIEKVIKQIQDIPDLSCRYGTLVLRGTRLDLKSCEALESIFRRIQFENLDLENCSLEEDGATSILEMVEFYQSTCKINIACNPKIGMRGWQALCRMLRKTHILTYLDARRTLLTDMTMPTFGRCLKADPRLKILHLEGVFLSGRPLLILTTAMKYNKVLEELYLGDNDLSSTDGPPIGAMLTYNTTLQLLDLRNNQMKDIGLAHIGNGLSDQAEQSSGGLCSLIMWNNGLTHEGMGYLCEGLVHTSSLKALNLGQNRIGDLGLQKLKGGLIKNKSLRKLGFLNTKLGSEGAVALAEVLADSLSITRIDIRENNIQTAGLMAFSMALKVNHSLLRLDLDKDIKKEPGMEAVMQTVLVDIYNFCHRNKKLVHQSLSASLSSISSDCTTVSSSSEIGDAISGDDVFHPETSKQDITPFSPGERTSVDGEEPGKELFKFEKELPIKTMEETTASSDNTTTESLGKSVASVFEAKRGRSQSDPGRKNPDPVVGKRTSRFSVTKILDTLTSGVANKIATNVASIDHKLKKQISKEKNDVVAKPAELVAIVEQVETSAPIVEHVETSAPIVEQVETKAVAIKPADDSKKNSEINETPETTEHSDNEEFSFIEKIDEANKETMSSTDAKPTNMESNLDNDVTDDVAKHVEGVTDLNVVESNSSSPVVSSNSFPSPVIAEDSSRSRSDELSSEIVCNTSAEILENNVDIKCSSATSEPSYNTLSEAEPSYTERNDEESVNTREDTDELYSEDNSTGETTTSFSELSSVSTEDYCAPILMNQPIAVNLPS